MNDLVVFGLLFAAIAIGWLLGRRSHPVSRSLDAEFPGQWRGFDRAADAVIDSFVDGLPSGGGSAKSLIAMGVQLRRKGEVDGAVRIHQDLLAAPSVAADDLVMARLELARDYISAGLLDWAEELLLELVREFPAQSEKGQRHLLEIYETERDWVRAIETARALLLPAMSRQPRLEALQDGGQSAALRLAHYCCERAEEERQAGDLSAARKLLLEALFRDKACVRASILLSQVEFDSGDYRRSALALRRVAVQNPDYLPETIELLRKSYNALGDQRSLRKYLLDCLGARPTPALVVAIAEDIALTEGAAAAGDFLAAHLLKYPSTGGLLQLIGLQVAASRGQPREDLTLLQGLTQTLVASRPSYRCGHCGFAGKHLHWNCPGCKHWGSIKAIGALGIH